MNYMYLRKSRAEEGQSTEEVLAKHRAALGELADRLAAGEPAGPHRGRDL